MATKKKPATKKPARKTTKGAATKIRNPAAKKASGKTSALDAAAKVLGESKDPLTTKEMVEAMGAKGY